MVSSTVTIGWVTWSYSITTLADPGSNGGGAPLASSQASTWDQETTTWSATSGDNLEEELAQLSSWTSTEREIFDVSAPVVVSNTYDQETQNAYAYAFTNGITTLPSIDAAFPFGKLYRRDVAKMIVEFSISQGKNTIIHSGCSFTDIQEVEVQLQAYMIHACRLGLMGLHGDGSPWEVFRPDDVLTRAEFGTLLSRMLRWVTYNSADPNAENRYEGHLQALKDSGIMQHIETPWAVELRVYAWIIFMRLSQKE